MVLSDFLYSFGAKQVLKMMKMKDVRTRFWEIPYIALVRISCRKSWKWTLSEPGFERFIMYLWRKTCWFWCDWRDLLACCCLLAKLCFWWILIRFRTHFWAIANIALLFLALFLLAITIKIELNLLSKPQAVLRYGALATRCSGR